MCRFKPQASVFFLLKRSCFSLIPSRIQPVDLPQIPLGGKNASSSAIRLAPDSAPSDLRSHPTQSLLPPDSLKSPEILHPESHRGSPVPSYCRDSATPDPSRALGSPPISQMLHPSPLRAPHYLIPPEMLHRESRSPSLPSWAASPPRSSAPSSSPRTCI